MIHKSSGIVVALATLMCGGGSSGADEAPICRVLRTTAGTEAVCTLRHIEDGSRDWRDLIFHLDDGGGAEAVDDGIVPPPGPATGGSEDDPGPEPERPRPVLRP